VFSLAQAPSALLAPALAERNRRWRRWAALAAGTFALGTLGALLAPLPPVLGPWPWVVLIGIGGGAMFPLGMTIIAWRTPDGATTAATSGLALGIGYTAAGLGPPLMGLLVDATGGYRAAIGVLLAAAAMQAWTILRIGGERRAN
jgi:MFS transporter, CP family, cyanate transporter